MKITKKIILLTSYYIDAVRLSKNMSEQKWLEWFYYRMSVKFLIILWHFILSVIEHVNMMILQSSTSCKNSKEQVQFQAK